MKLVTFTYQGETRIGVLSDAGVVDLSRVAPGLPNEMVSFLGLGRHAMDAAHAAVRDTADAIPLADVALRAPVLRPGKFLVHGANYLPPATPLPSESEVARAARRPGPAMSGIIQEMRSRGHQLWLNKQVTSITGPYADVILPAISPEVVPETELAIVIGRRAWRVPVEEAAAYIGGYTVCNDLTTLDWVQNSPTATLGKSFPTHGPIGPWIVTPDEVHDPQNLALRTSINGELRLVGSTSRMIRSCVEQIAYLSQVMPLEPGDILSTGTEGVTAEFLRVGDIVRCEVEGIGFIENAIVADDPG